MQWNVFSETRKKYLEVSDEVIKVFRKRVIIIPQFENNRTPKVKSHFDEFGSDFRFSNAEYRF